MHMFISMPSFVVFLVSHWQLWIVFAAASLARDLSDKEVVEMLRKKPRYVPQLQVCWAAFWISNVLLLDGVYWLGLCLALRLVSALFSDKRQLPRFFLWCIWEADAQVSVILGIWCFTWTIYIWVTILLGTGCWLMHTAKRRILNTTFKSACGCSMAFWLSREIENHTCDARSVGTKNSSLDVFDVTSTSCENI